MLQQQTAPRGAVWYALSNRRFNYLFLNCYACGKSCSYICFCKTFVNLKVIISRNRVNNNIFCYKHTTEVIACSCNCRLPICFCMTICVYKDCSIRNLRTASIPSIKRCTLNCGSKCTTIKVCCTTANAESCCLCIECTAVNTECTCRNEYKSLVCFCTIKFTSIDY